MCWTCMTPFITRLAERAQYYVTMRVDKSRQGQGVRESASVGEHCNSMCLPGSLIRHGLVKRMEEHAKSETDTSE